MSRFERRTGKVIASAGAMVIAAAGPLLLASQVSAATPPCFGDSSSGTCTLIDPGGQTSVGAISYQRGSNGDLAITVPFTSDITDFHLCYDPGMLTPYLPVPGENPSQNGITGRECTPNGPLVRQYGATRIGPDASVTPNPVSAGGTSTFLFTVRSRDYWYVHLVVDGNTLAASSPAPFRSTSLTAS